MRVGIFILKRKKVFLKRDNFYNPNVNNVTTGLVGGMLLVGSTAMEGTAFGAAQPAGIIAGVIGSAVGGAITGASIAGPIGAAIGTVVGTAAAIYVANESEPDSGFSLEHNSTDSVQVVENNNETNNLSTENSSQEVQVYNNIENSTGEVNITHKLHNKKL